jgi:LmbE family N-acetylglucosaminyl deacetylase
VTAAFGRSILILAPHPDDEVVACHAAIGRARADGAELRVLYLTHGCLDRDTVWPWERGRHRERIAQRRFEAETAAFELGLTSAGWPDRPARALWRDLAAAEAEVAAAVQRFGADQLWVPAYEGGNPDHDGANAVASRFAAAGLAVLEFAAYNFAGGRARSHAFPAPTGAEEVLILTPAERAAKQRALDLYASEKGNLGYVRTNLETFRPLPAHDYRRPPHPGRLWYARFQWVPFAHPGVDRTDPDDVCAAIKAYLSAASQPALSRH